METVPKTMQAKARRLMERLKRDVAWTSRGELIHEGVFRGNFPSAAGSARKSLSWTPLGRRRSQMEHSVLIPPTERRKPSTSLTNWEDI